MAPLHPKYLDDSRWQELLHPAVLEGLCPLDRDNLEAFKAAWTKVKVGALRPFVIDGLVNGIDKPVLLAALLATGEKEAFSGRRNLYVWSLFGYTALNDEHWAKIWLRLRAATKRFGFGSLMAQTNNPKVIELVTRLGGKVVASLVRLEV